MFKNKYAESHSLCKSCLPPAIFSLYLFISRYFTLRVSSFLITTWNSSYLFFISILKSLLLTFSFRAPKDSPSGDMNWKTSIYLFINLSLTWWAWVWASFESWWWTGRSDMLQSMGLQRVGHDWVAELNWTDLSIYLFLPPWANETGHTLLLSFIKECFGEAWTANVLLITKVMSTSNFRGRTQSFKY